jgi:hypothetical protein
MSKPILRCNMQDNGFRQNKSRELTLKECQDLFNCCDTNWNCTYMPIPLTEEKRLKGIRPTIGMCGALEII